jgi:hypothetical protein
MCVCLCVCVCVCRHGGRSITPPPMLESILSLEELLKWTQDVTAGYRGVKVTNMTTSWRTGMGFLAIIHYYRPNLMSVVNPFPTPFQFLFSFGSMVGWLVLTPACCHHIWNICTAHSSYSEGVCDGLLACPFLYLLAKGTKSLVVPSYSDTELEIACFNRVRIVCYFV